MPYKRVSLALLGGFYLMGVHGGAVLNSNAALTPFQRLAPCSSAVFMIFTATGYSTGAHGIVKPGARSVNWYPHVLANTLVLASTSFTPWNEEGILLITYPSCRTQQDPPFYPRRW